MPFEKFTILVSLFSFLNITDWFLFKIDEHLNKKNIQPVKNVHSVMEQIPRYIEYTEIPLICYLYKIYIRKCVFLYREVCKDVLKISDNTLTQYTCWNYRNSEYIIRPNSHVITGDIITILLSSHLRLHIFIHS